MTNLIKWQLMSMISRFLAMGIGIVQGIFVVRLLTTADYGLVGIVTAVGSVAGIILHLGLVSGATREIAAVQDRTEAFKIFVSALLARLSLALLLSLVLFLGSNVIARKVYQHPEISLALKLYAAMLLVQASQGIFNAVLSGFKQFKSIFVFQVVIALVSLALYVPLIYHRGFYGYFWAMLALAVVHTAVLFILVRGCFVFSAARRSRLARKKARLLGSFPKPGFGELPAAGEIVASLRRILSVGLAIYLVKIIFTLWEKFGPLVLGKAVTAAEVGIFNFALFYSTKLMTASDAVTDVSLPVFSERFSEGLNKFRSAFLSNFEKIYAFITLAAASAIFWSKELVHLVVGHKYDEALPLIPFLILAFWAYSFVNIVTSSLMVPAKLNREMIVSYIFLLLGTVGGFYGFNALSRHPEFISGMVRAMALGGVLALFYQWLSVRRTLRLEIFGLKAALLTGSLLPLLVVYGLSFGFWPKILLFTLNLGLFSYLLNRLGILDWRRAFFLVGKTLSMSRKR